MTRVIKAGRERIVAAEVAGARAQADAIRAAAHRQGFEAGRQEGLAAVTELLVRARAEAAGAEADLRRLAVRIAEKILGRELTLAPDAVVDVVRTALAAAAPGSDLVVHVHPDDLAAVRAGLGVSVCADAGVAPGGCRIETPAGTIDACLDVQLAALERALVAP